jgi:hypothetical protein
MPLHRREHDYYLTRAMDAAVSRRSQHEIAVTLLDRAELEQKRGRRIEAAALLARARSAFEAMDMTWHAAKAQQLLLSAV